MRTTIKDIKGLLAEHRVFLPGRGVSRMDQSASSYPEDTVVTVQGDIQLDPYTTYWAGSGKNLITMGAFSYTHSTLPISASVGRYTSIALGLRVMGEKHPHEWASSSPSFYNRRVVMETFEADRGREGVYQTHTYRPGPIVIGNDVWIGENVTLGHGVHVGDGAVVASNAVVTKDVPAYTVVGGVAAKPLRSRFDTGLVEDLKDLRWWQYAPDDVSDLDVRNPAIFVEGLRKRVDASDIAPYQPAPLTIEHFQSQAGQL